MTTRLTPAQLAFEASAPIGLIDDVVADRHGRVVKALGDGVMLRFESVVQAVLAARDLMARLTEAGLPAAHAGVDLVKGVDLPIAVARVAV